MPVDYSKWDDLGKEVDKEEAAQVDPNRNYVQKLENHKASQTLIAGWLQEAAPELKEKPEHTRAHAQAPVSHRPS